MKILLDTNVYAALMRGVAPVVERVTRAQQVLLSTVVAGELMFGFRRGTRWRKNLAQFNAFIDNPHVTVVPVSLTTADRFGRIAALGLCKLPVADFSVSRHDSAVLTVFLGLATSFNCFIHPNLNVIYKRCPLKILCLFICLP